MTEEDEVPSAVDLYGSRMPSDSMTDLPRVLKPGDDRPKLFRSPIYIEHHSILTGSEEQK
jgi:hypothetical protein